MYRNPGIKKKEPELVLWGRRNRGFSTETWPEMKSQYCPNTTILPVGYWLITESIVEFVL